MPVVNLPPGNTRVQMEDGTLYRATRAGGKITVSDEHAKDIDKLRGNGEGGLLHASFREYGESKGGRVCSCGPTVYYEWTKQCPKCGEETQPRS